MPPTTSPTPGSTTIAPEVLLNLARLTALSVEGVSRMGASPSQFKQWARPKQAMQGVEVKTDGELVNLDIHVILKNDVNLRRVSRTIQSEVARSLTEMVGMQAGQINIHIEDIDFPAND